MYLNTIVPARDQGQAASAHHETPSPYKEYHTQKKPVTNIKYFRLLSSSPLKIFKEEETGE